MREKEVRGLMEAYSQVYAPQELTEEQVWEEVETWVNSLIEEGHDLSDYTWEEMYEAYLEEAPKKYNLLDLIGKAAEKTGQGLSKGVQGAQKSAQVPYGGGLSNRSKKETPAKPTPSAANGDKKPKLSNIPPSTKNSPVTSKNYSGDQAKAYKAGGGDAAMAKGGGTVAEIIARGRKAAKPSVGSGGSGGSDGSGGSGGSDGSGGSGGSGGSRTTAPKPATPAAPAAKQTGDKTKDTATFAKANPGLAAAAAERARTRGTSQSDNPLMKGMPGKRPMTPSVQSPTLAKDLGKGSGNQSLVNNPNASKAAPPKPAATGNTLSQTTTAASKPAAFSPTPAAAPKPEATPAPKPTPAATGSKKPGSIVSSVDLFDLVKGHLLDEGYADSEEGAMVIMVNMSEGWKESILESCGVELELDESQHARENPDEYERSSEAREGRRKRSGINDPKTGINSPAFQAFMAKQMGGKKKKD